MFDGETATKTFQTLNANQGGGLPSLLLPNKELWDCCSQFKIKVLANVDEPNDNFQNDFTSFIEACSSSASGAVYKLWKGSTLVGTMSGGSIYGTDYPFGFVTSQGRKYVGYKVNWVDVLGNHGDGIYKVSLEITDSLLGNSEAFSFEYSLCRYRADRADVTVRLQWYLNGTIGDVRSERMTFDYLNLNWVNQIRISGFFGFPEGTYTKENVQYQNGVREWTFDEMEQSYKIKTKPIPSHIHNLLMVQTMQSDRCLITDYNAKNTESYVDKEIMFETEYKPDWKPLVSRLAPVQLSVKLRFNNYKKRRF
jgi:hypothetical protein